MIVARETRGERMTGDDDFTPRLGRIRSAPPRQEGRYLGQVLKGTAKAGGRALGRHSGFTGARIGRGAGVGRVLGSRDKYAAFRARRVIVKTRIIKLQGKLNSAKVHLRYLERDGVTREGRAGELYDAEHDRADGKAFLERSADDRHQFRFIVSPDDGAEYDDLKGFTRRLMARMEADLGTKLDWVAVDHHNTGHPHSHILVRGKCLSLGPAEGRSPGNETGRDLVIARDYIRHGMRERASEIVTLDLGPRTDRDIETALRAEIEQERFTSLDRRLQREADKHGVVRSGLDKDAFRQALHAGRLQKLRRLGLAAEIAPGHWQISDDLEPVLRRMGARGDIIKTIHAELTRQGRERAPADYAIYDPADPSSARLIGRVTARGLADEEHDRHYLVVDGIDGRTHYVDIGHHDDAFPDGSVVAITPKPVGARAVDRTVAKIAAAHGGRYSIDIHLRHDSGASRGFAEAHVRRLEAMRRQGGLVERVPDGSWAIAPDHVERAAEFERQRARLAPVAIETLSALPLERPVASDGATWLDRELVAREPAAVCDSGFGREVRQALIRRQQWLVEQDLARREADQIVYRANLLSVLRRREVNRAGNALARELGLEYCEARSGEQIEGLYRRPIDLASGRYALIEKSREFTLVPWRPALERGLGQEVSGLMRGEGISWTIGRQRRGPEIS